jgi:hypothetical protein
MIAATIKTITVYFLIFLKNAGVTSPNLVKKINDGEFEKQSASNNRSTYHTYVRILL